MNANERTIEDILSRDNLDCLDIAYAVAEDRGNKNISNALIILIVLFAVSIAILAISGSMPVDTAPIVAGM